MEPARFTARFAPAAAALLLALLLAGCRQAEGEAPTRLRTILFLAVGVTGDKSFDVSLQQELRGSIGRMVTSFQALEPGVKVQVQVIDENRLVGILRKRNRSGLGPDLLLLTQEMADHLTENHLIRPVRLPSAVTRQIQPAPLERVRRPDGRFIGLPLAVFPQLACFDRRRVSRSPSTVEELMEGIASGMRVSLPIQPADLLWTIGAQGAMGSFLEIREGAGVTPEARRRIRQWLAWLQELGLMQRFSFAHDPIRVRQDLIDGELDWTLCGSDDLNRMRQKLGNDLGVAPLPSGPGGPPSPVSRLWLIAFGVNSNDRQHRAAERLGFFAANPQMQRIMTLRDMEGLPVNRLVDVPVESSYVLQSLVTARDQSRNADPLLRDFHPAYPLAIALRGILSEFLFGLKDLDEATEAVIGILKPQEQP